ncbi:MAG: TIGR02281 family clan AA aspartic protease [Hyphomicrobiaceae bacterium]
MAISSGTQNLLKQAGGWLLAAGLSFATLTYFDDIRTALGLRITADDIADPEPAAGEPKATRAAAATAPKPDRSVEIRAGASGHFETTAYINGRPVLVMVDTGATTVAMPYEDAEAAGIFLRESDFTQRVQTANGIARVASVMIDTLSIDDITVRNVRAAVTERGKLKTTLLGMSFLGRLSKAEMSRGVLLLQE